MFIVAGYLRLRPGSRDEFIRMSEPAIGQARRDPECLDFSVSPDPLDADRVNIFELWSSQEELHRFRDEGPGEAMAELIVSATVKEWSV